MGLTTGFVVRASRAREKSCFETASWSRSSQAVGGSARDSIRPIRRWLD